MNSFKRLEVLIRTAIGEEDKPEAKYFEIIECGPVLYFVIGTELFSITIKKVKAVENKQSCE